MCRIQDDLDTVQFNKKEKKVSSVLLHSLTYLTLERVTFT
jgi:hypothetical protein